MRIVLIGFFLALLFSGCDSGYPQPADAAHANDVSAITVKSVQIGDEDFQAEHGSIALPENWDIAGSRLISIPFVRVVSKTRTTNEPIFLLTGGPGNSNLSWDLKFALPLLRNHDLIMVGYRGVDGSSVLNCPEVKEAMTVGDPLTEGAMKRIGRAWIESAQRLKNNGVDINGYNMIGCIEDFEAVRTALGYPRINLLSKSYGTRLAYMYGVKYPDRIFRSAMVSVNPPGHFGWEPAMIDKQLRYYSSLWEKDSLMTTKSPDLYKSMSNVLLNMPSRWMGIPISAGKVKVATFSLLYHRKTAALVFDAYLAAEHGDASGLALLSVAYDVIVPSLMVWGDATKAVGADFDSTRNYSVENDPSPAAPLGSPLGKLLWGPMNFGRWPVKPLPEKYRTLQHSSVETLLLSGNVDFSTPAEYATNELLPFLSKGKQVVLADCGHTGDVLDPETSDGVKMLESFYETGVVNVDETKYKPMDFNVGLTLTMIAKVALVLIALLGVGLMWVLWKVYRKIIRVSRRTF